VSFVGDYSQETEMCFNQTSIPKSTNIFIAYQNKNSDKNGNKTITP